MLAVVTSSSKFVSTPSLTVALVFPIKTVSRWPTASQLDIVKYPRAKRLLHASRVRPEIGVDCILSVENPSLQGSSNRLN